MSNLRKDLKDEKERLTKAISAYRESCDHEMRYTGHDSHKDHYICCICGINDER